MTRDIPAVQFLLRSILIPVFLVILLQPSPGRAQINAEFFMAVGRQELSKGNYSAAIERLNVVVQVDPGNHEAWFLRAVAKYNLGDQVGAERDLTRTINLHPLLSVAWHYRGVVRDNLQDYYNALTDLDRAVKLDPFSSEILVSRGMVKIHMKSYTWSLPDLDSAIRLNPKNPQAFSTRAVARVSLKDYEGALADCDRAVQLDPLNFEVYLKRGVIRAETEDYAGAMEDFNYAEKLDDSNPYIYFNRAVARINLADTAGAVADFTRVLELDPYNALTFYNRALLRSQTGDLYGALEDYEKVLRLNPDNVYTYYNRAIIRHQQEDYRGAIADYSRAIELFPDFAGAWLNRSDAREKIGDRKGAYTDFQKGQAIVDNINRHGYDSLVVKQYADSAYFSKIIAFEADFISSPGTTDGMADISVEPEPSFQVLLSLSDKDYVDFRRAAIGLDEIKSLESLAPKSLHFILSNEASDLLREDELDKIRRADSLAHDASFSPGIYLVRGIINAMMRNYKSAMEDFDQATYGDQVPGMVYFTRANLKFDIAENAFSGTLLSVPVTISWGESLSAPAPEATEIPDYGTALNDYDRAIALMPGFAFAYFNRGNLKARMKDYTGALADYARATELAPGLGAAWFNKGLTLIYLHDTDAACEDLSRAGELGLEEAYQVIARFCRK